MRMEHDLLQTQSNSCHSQVRMPKPLAVFMQNFTHDGDGDISFFINKLMTNSHVQ